MASSLPPSPYSLSPSLHPARLNLLHLRRRRRRLLICHSCETLRGRKVSPPRCFSSCCSFFLASLESHKIMIGIFAGNLNCLPAFFSSLFSSLCRSFFSFNYLQFSFSTRFPVYFMQHLRWNTWKSARNSSTGILLPMLCFPSLPSLTLFLHSAVLF